MASKTAKKKPGKAAAPATRRGYPDLHDHIEALKRAGLLIVVDRKINKDTEMHPLVRWQYRIEATREKWIRAMTKPIPPRIVKNAPCQEIVYKGADLKNGHGLDDIPVPISSPGWDNAPYTTSSHFIT